MGEQPEMRNPQQLGPLNTGDRVLLAPETCDPQAASTSGLAFTDQSSLSPNHMIGLDEFITLVGNNPG